MDSRGCELLHYLTDIYRKDLAITSNKFFLLLIYTFYINIVLFSAQNHLYSYVHYIISFIPTDHHNNSVIKVKSGVIVPFLEQ